MIKRQRNEQNKAQEVFCILIDLFLLKFSLLNDKKSEKQAEQGTRSFLHFDRPFWSSKTKNFAVTKLCEVYMTFYFPVEPNPPLPLVVLSSSSTSM